MRAGPLEKKGIALIYFCRGLGRGYSDIDDVKVVALELVRRLSERTGIRFRGLEFRDNEGIGDRYMVYRFRSYVEDVEGSYIGIRIVTYEDSILLGVATIDREVARNILENRDIIGEVVDMDRDIPHVGKSMDLDRPPGQRYIPRFVIYKILGQPQIDVMSWVLEVDGRVRNRLKFTYDDILKMPKISFRSNFHCVTGWSVRDVMWEGIPLRHFYELAGVEDGVNWVYVTSVDGYTTIIPLQDFISERAILALRMDGKPIPIEHGYPARIFIPHLYGWKGAKWVTKFTFLDRYRDGYWEALGYHERGNVVLEERFKGR
jgi:DMSO/TMAO reductase YedYZ molybdopterin-dependent catalytic subunit